MNLQAILPKALQRKPVFHVNPEHHITKVFEENGHTVSRFTDEFNIPSERGFAAFHHYEKLVRRADDKFLNTHTEAVDKILDNPTIVKIGELKKLNTDLRERLTMFYPPDLIWNLASVLFFDETENPYSYDSVYAEQKIARWKKSKDIYDFFLLHPFKDLMPQSNISKEDFNSFLRIANLIDQKHWEALLPAFSLSPKKIFFIKNVLSQLKQDEALYS